MKNFITIAKFELDNYFKSKGYIISTILICILCIGIMFVPRIKESFSSDNNDQVEESAVSDGEIEKIALYDTNGFVNDEVLATFFVGKEIVRYDNVDSLKKDVESEKVEFGFGVNSDNEFDYYVFNKSMMDNNSGVFQEYMSMQLKINYCEANNLDQEEFFGLESAAIKCNEKILGKDGESNYFYCYILVIIVFMLIVMYGMTIATGVTNEKSNRSIEILVTSTSSTALLFGKVFAGAIATVFQVGVIALSLLGSYNFNKAYFPVNIGAFLDIPAEVLVVFAIFGVGGFLFYAFMYGALGALVSKIEDLNKSAGTAQMLVMIVYFVTLMQLFNVDGIIMKVCSFLPFSSYSAMFARVAMGEVAIWEIILTAVILYASVVVMGIIGGKIFRNSTLRYGNPIKLTNALKGLKKSE